MPFAATWMKLGIVILNKISQTEKEKYHITSPTNLMVFKFGMSYPLQCSCLENLRDGGAWWAAVSAVAQSQTRLK